MLPISSVAELRNWRRAAAKQGERIAFVPTMGALHDGHLKLVDVAHEHAERVVMSVFVNPLQFAPGEDFERYPRNIERDAALAESHGVDVMFVPSVTEVYGSGDELRVVAGETASRWEGAIRPGHFDGVLTVVAKLFNMVAPDLAVFGQKDIQQVTLIRSLIQEMNFPIELCVVATVREADGLAMSSRNVYLTPSQRSDALSLSRALHLAREAWQKGEHQASELTRLVGNVLNSVEGVVTDYIAVVEPRHLAPVDIAREGTIIALAARVGATRLIDNTILNSGVN